MSDAARDVSQHIPRKICRNSEAHDTAILTLALRSLMAVKAEHDASWPFRVEPQSQFFQPNRLS